MTVEACKKIRDAVRGKAKIVIIGDNGETFVDGIEGTAVLWNDKESYLTVIRPNQAINQANAKFEVITCDYENIQYLLTYVNEDLLEDVLKATGHSSADAAYAMLTKSDVMKANVTKPSSDGIEGYKTNFTNVMNDHKEVKKDDQETEVEEETKDDTGESETP